MNYPWKICFDCGKKHGRRIPECATCHTANCDICGKLTTVTQPRDFGQLKEGWDKK